MKKILFPIAVASALSIAALGTLQGLAQDDAAQAAGEGEKKGLEAKEPETKEAEKKEEPAKGADEKVTESSKQPVADLPAPKDGFVEKFLDKDAEAMAKGVLAEGVAERVIKLVARAKELRKQFTEKIKELRDESEKPGITDSRVRYVANTIPDYAREIRTLDDRFHNFFRGMKKDAQLTTLQRLQMVAVVSQVVEDAQNRLEGRRVGPGFDVPPPGPRPRMGRLTLNAELAQTQGVATLEHLPEAEAKAFAIEWFPDKFFKRVETLVTRGKELQTRFNEKIKELDTEAAMPGLDDEKIRSLASEVTMLREGARELNQAFFQFFYNPGLRNEDMQSLAKRLARVTTLSEAVEAAEVKLGLRAASAGADVAAAGTQPAAGVNRDKGGEKSESPKPGDAEQQALVIPNYDNKFVENLTPEAAEIFAKKAFPEEAAARVIKLAARGKELRKLLEEKIKEVDSKATEPGLDEQQINSLAENVNVLRSEIGELDQAYFKFFNQDRYSGSRSWSIANRLALIPSLDRAVESAEVRLGLRSAPSPDARFPGGSSARGPRPAGGRGFNWPNPPTVVNLLSESMKDEEIKVYLQERFPAAAMDRIGKLVARARELAKTLDEKIAGVDAELLNEKLSDEQIESMAQLARTYRNEKEGLNNAFRQLTIANLSMQTMSEAVSWLPQLSRAVGQAERNVKSIEREALFVKAGTTASAVLQTYENAKTYLNARRSLLSAAEKAGKDPNRPAEQRKARQEEAKVLRGTIQKLVQAIEEFDSLQEDETLSGTERSIAAAKAMREAMTAPKTPGGAAGSESSTAADPKEAHAKLYQRAKSLIEQIDNKLKEIGVQLADPGIASDELDRIANQSNDLQFAVHGIRQAVAGYENSIQNQASPNQSMVVGNVVEMQHAIRKGEDVLGIKVSVSVASDTPYADVVRKIEAAAGDGVRIVIGSDLSPVAQRLIAACDSVKSQLEARLKETDEKLNAPEAALEQIEGLAKFKSRIETAINRCESVRESLRSNKLRTAGQFAQVASELQDYTAKIVRPQLGPSGPVYTPTGMMQGMVQGMMASPTGSMGGSPMGPGMPMVGPPGMSGMPGLPGAAPAAQFPEIHELRVRYRKYLDEKNEKAAAEVKEKIAKELARIFDAQQAAREKQLDAAKDRLKKLEEQQAKRKAARDELIESRTKQIIHELEGTEWTDDAPVEEGGN